MNARMQVLTMLLCLLMWGLSTPSNPGWREPHPVLDGGVPHPVLDEECPIQSWMGVPHPVLDGGQGTPTWTWDGVPSTGWGTHHLDLRWGTPSQLDGVPPAWTWEGVPLISWMGDGVPPQNVDRQTPVKTVPSLMLHTRVVKITESH